MLMDLSPTKSLSKSATFSILLFSLFLLLTGNLLAQKGNAYVRGLARGQAAINKLSNRLPAVALRYGKSPSDLRQLLLQDPTLYIDDTDNLLYIDDAPEETEKFDEDAPSSPQAGPFPYNETFSLHSRPGSNRVIYLDFDGYVTTGTAWNTSFTGGQTINSAPFNFEGDPNSFSQLEQDAIQYIWQRVAEDYAPFDVDVTTQDPGDAAILRSSSLDLQYGTRVVISPTNFVGSGTGGIAFVGSFNSFGTSFKPAFVFSAALNSEKGIAEAASHEVGHNLGLDHDGTSSSEYYAGQGDWAPIMGVSYNRAVTQWSKGEYPDANQLQDDLAIIQSYGTPVISDDHGDSSAAATVLSGININASGLITTRSDIDVFKFSTAGGNVTLNLNPAPRGGNLNIEAKISDAQGNVIATSNPAGLSANFNQTLSAGDYYLTIDGVGSSDYSDYASIGQYSITGTLTNGQPPTPTPPTPTPPPPGNGCTPTTTVTEGDLFAGGIPSFGVSSGAGSVTVDHVNAGAGLQSFTVVSATNATVNIPAFTPSTFAPVVVTFTAINPNLAVDFTLRAASTFHAIFVRVRCGGETQACTPTATVTEGDLFAGGIPSFGVASGAGSVTVDHVNAGAGLQSLTVVSATNAAVNIPASTPGTYAPVTATYTIINPSLPVDFTLRAASTFHAIFVRVRCGGTTLNTFSGRATSVNATIAGVNAILNDTGALPAAGGFITQSLASGNLFGGALTTGELEATTQGAGDQSRSQAVVSNLNLTVG
ncbi:MAG: hypothetical protein M3367_09750, partial [Acidobacteriota bacterium]|nr:hypothetical protein [Acidobacteriota bacterium]